MLARPVKENCGNVWIRYTEIMEQTPDWDRYRTFLAVLEEGSLSGAARRLGLTQPTVGRHVEAIEAGLKQPLFVRSQRGLSPTPAAQALRPYAEALRDTAEALVRAASRPDGAPEGLVRITASEVIAAEVLPFVLQDHAWRHPRLALEIQASNRTADLLHRAADIAVRMTAPVQQSLLAVKIGEVEVGLFATPGYVARRGRLERVDDMAGHVLIGYAQQTPYIRALAAGLPLPPPDAFAWRTDSDLAAVGAVRAGLGIGFCQVGIGRREGWVRILPEAFRVVLPAWVAMHEDLKANRACRDTFDALVEGLRAYIAPR
jgi:DNA-binding transcriptional LysR family regulator